MEPGKNIYIVSFSLKKNSHPSFVVAVSVVVLVLVFFFLFKGRREGRRKKKRMILRQRWVFVNTHQNAEKTEKRSILMPFL
ncbi:hypothetical protein IMY05_002G0097600 [Salix suchowensis]|nr:hypothetical protein IMY05_002G0097600 [Salix suchowensis]